jgi:hypothetical protein
VQKNPCPSAFADLSASAQICVAASYTFAKRGNTRSELGTRIHTDNATHYARIYTDFYEAKQAQKNPCPSAFADLSASAQICVVASFTFTKRGDTRSELGTRIHTDNATHYARIYTDFTKQNKRKKIRVNLRLSIYRHLRKSVLQHPLRLLNI